MSNAENNPIETVCEPGVPVAEILEPRLVPLGGLRSMNVRRTLPQRARSLIGGWCFVDHYGPNNVAEVGGMTMNGHPHTGLQTVTWLFAGEVEHKDTIGSVRLVRPGEVNLMTAGAGIAHSEYSTPQTATLHGVQLWLAIPNVDRFTEPSFENFVTDPLELDGATVRVFIGELAGRVSPVRTFSRLVGAQLELSPGASLTLDVDPTFEHGLLVDQGAALLGDVKVAQDQLAYQPTGCTTLTITATEDGPARLLLLGGEPLGEHIVMWWNFIGRTHEEIVEFRERWQARVGTPNTDPHDSQDFGGFPDDWLTVIPAPELPNARLKPRS